VNGGGVSFNDPARYSHVLADSVDSRARSNWVLERRGCHGRVETCGPSNPADLAALFAGSVLIPVGGIWFLVSAIRKIWPLRNVKG
jgi:hypothetical protein